MNRWIIRGLATAGFAGGVWLLGTAHAYAHDSSTTTTTDVRLGATVAVPAVPAAAEVDATGAVGRLLTFCVHVAVNSGTAGCHHPAAGAQAGVTATVSLSSGHLSHVRPGHAGAGQGATAAGSGTDAGASGSGTGASGSGTGASGSGAGAEGEPATDGTAAGNADRPVPAPAGQAPNGRGQSAGGGRSAGDGRSAGGGSAGACRGDTSRVALTRLAEPMAWSPPSGAFLGLVVAGLVLAGFGLIRYRRTS